MAQVNSMDIELADPPKKSPERGPIVGTIWLFVVFLAMAVISTIDVDRYNALYFILGPRSITAFLGYFIMQIGLWYTENKWDEEGSAAWMEAAGVDKSAAPEELDALADNIEATIPADKLTAAFPTPWGFLIGWWVWGASYLFPINGELTISPTGFGIAALVVCIFVSFDASIPMADAVMNRLDGKKKMLSVLFLFGWITLGIMSALDIKQHIENANAASNPGYNWVLTLMGPVTIIMSQKILFSSRKMGTKWEESGRPNFDPIVYNMGGPLFVLGWFMLLLATSSVPYTVSQDDPYGFPSISKDALGGIPLFLNVRTIVAFISGCGMVPVVRFLDYSHDKDGPWLGANTEGAVFKKWWLGTDGTYFGVFLESPWPFVIMWFGFGLASFFTLDNSLEVGWRSALVMVNCIAQGVDAGILIQSNLYAGNMAGKNKWSVPFLLMFIALAINIGSTWEWKTLALSLPGAILIVAGQKTVFGARRRGDYSMQNGGKANPYDKVFVYTWGEVFFMAGWILICWGASMPQ